MEQTVPPTGPNASEFLEVVREFAKKQGLRFEAWHQDEPIFYISRDEPRPDKWLLTRYMQLVWVRDDQTLRISAKATPGARMVNEDSARALVMIRAPQAHYSALLPSDHGYAFSPSLWELLDSTWHSAEKLDPLNKAEFVEESLPSSFVA